VLTIVFVQLEILCVLCSVIEKHYTYQNDNEAVHKVKLAHVMWVCKGSLFTVKVRLS